jgi:hypothetical protein
MLSWAEEFSIAHYAKIKRRPAGDGAWANSVAFTTQHFSAAMGNDVEQFAIRIV